MTALVEFALFAWVAISVVAVLVQLIRLALYKRSARSTGASKEGRAASTESRAGERRSLTSDPSTINLEERLAAGAPATSADTTDTEAPVEAALAHSASRTTDTLTGGRAPGTPIADSTPTAATTATASAAPQTGPAPDPIAGDPAAGPAQAEPAATEPATLADLLAGVRLPWNLLPTVDHGQSPSNHRVALITDQGEPAQIGVDVADELERLGFTITPHGEDTAIASKNGRSLGLRIIPDPAQAEIDGRRRFPNASDRSVALDIWVE